MSDDTAAVPEYCWHCGRKLGSVRILIVGGGQYHPECNEERKARFRQDSRTDHSTAAQPLPGHTRW